jgi:two-component system, OmpR family, KDP operon response regulator KdpE
VRYFALPGRPSAAPCLRVKMTDRVLVCDPNPQVQRALKVILRQAGYGVLSTSSGQDAVHCAATDHPRAVILEVALPDLSGIELCRRLRGRGRMPILVLSEIDDERTKIEALESGADDYVTKPFSPGELLARLAARLRASPSALRVEVDGLVIDVGDHTVTRDGERVHLTATEFALLRVLVTSRGTVSYRALTRRVWGRSRGNDVQRLRTHVANLRGKLDNGRGMSVIETECGIGYRFTDGQRTAPAAVHPQRMRRDL